MAGIVLRGAALSKALKSELESILEDDFYSLNAEGDTVASEVTEGVFETVEMEEGDHSRWRQYRHCVTKSPDGKFYAWDWQYGSGDTEHEGPGEYGDVELTEVKPVTSTLVVINYVPVETDEEKK